MLLVLSEGHKEHLAFLPQVDASVVGEFGRIALQFLRKGSSPKIYEGAARKLCVPVEMVQHGVEGLMFLMTECSKHMISGVDFLDSVLILGFGDELNQILLQHHNEIRTILSQLPSNLPAYNNLEWRLDVQLASRSVRQRVIPLLTVHLHLTRGCDSCSDHSSMVLQTDPSTLLHLISTLEIALATMKTTHTRRILRNIK
ncbi:COMM domain-containing protein 2 isoform X2 [Anabas testudineus]|uniref:COMM domain-containing protein 2 isoform X2 n=1 Tax=Anabas testudineus TaxID=64144 RepID=UPI000E45DD25|nr:COMM domain-containing protein 2 isoform X2 [Anabas testudineus]